jgi:pantoate--beta-alanine ligase
MKLVHTVAELRQLLGQAGPVALVPTMGCLHAGHASLVEIAASGGLPVVASVFVNRLQFAPGEDFERYPRTLEEDLSFLRSKGCHLVFAPTEQELYPQPQTFFVIPPPGLADPLEGCFRRGFFTGVCTVVSKLLSIVRPDTAVFGKKDYQQWRIIDEMVRQMALGTRVLAGEVVRDADGLALSSRNRYLTEAERREAPTLARELETVAGSLQRGSQDHTALEQLAMQRLRDRGWFPDYVSIRDRRSLQPARPESLPDALVVLGAAKLGTTRLIDAIEV